MKIVVHGTQNGFGIFYSNPGTPLSITKDMRNSYNGEKPLGKSLYSIAFAENGFFISKYMSILDVERQAIGTIVFSLFVSKNEKIYGTDIKDLLDKLLNEFCQKHVKDNRLDKFIENWEFLNDILYQYQNKVDITSNNEEIYTAGNAEAAYIYYLNDSQLCKYFDNPQQIEYLNYQQIFLVDKDLKDSDENPIITLKHSDNLTGKIDIENSVKYKTTRINNQITENQFESNNIISTEKEKITHQNNYNTQTTTTTQQSSENKITNNKDPKNSTIRKVIIFTISLAIVTTTFFIMNSISKSKNEKKELYEKITKYINNKQFNKDTLIIWQQKYCQREENNKKTQKIPDDLCSKIENAIAIFNAIDNKNFTELKNNEFLKENRLSEIDSNYKDIFVVVLKNKYGSADINIIDMMTFMNKFSINLDSLLSIRKDVRSHKTKEELGKDSIRVVAIEDFQPDSITKNILQEIYRKKSKLNQTNVIPRSNPEIIINKNNVDFDLEVKIKEYLKGNIEFDKLEEYHKVGNISEKIKNELFLCMKLWKSLNGDKGNSYHWMKTMIDQYKMYEDLKGTQLYDFLKECQDHEKKLIYWEEVYGNKVKKKNLENLIKEQPYKNE